MESQKVKVYGGGKLSIPAAFRQRLGISEGDAVIVELVGDELRIRATATSVRRAQETLRRFNPDRRSLVDELIAERRREADGE